MRSSGCRKSSERLNPVCGKPDVLFEKVSLSTGMESRMSQPPEGEIELAVEKKWMTGNKGLVLRGLLAFVLIALFFTGGMLVTFAIADFQRDQYFEVRKYQAAAAAASIEASDVDVLTGTDKDIGTPAFNKLRQKLQRVKGSDSRTRFVYLMRPRDGKMIFLVDAENPASRDYSPPGQVYYEAKPEEFYPFVGKKRPDPWILGPITDRWGTWVSANAYVVNKDGSPVALLGTDVGVGRALSSFNQIKEIGTVFTVVGCILLAILFFQWIVWSYNRDRRLAARLAMEESMLELNSKLLEADRLKTEFIQSVSHELRGPVTAVNGAMQVLAQHVSSDLDDDGKMLMDIAWTGTGRMVKLVDNLLDMTRIEAGGVAIRLEKVGLRELVDNTVKVFAALAREKGIGLKTTFAGEDLLVDIDGEAIQRVLENLIANSIKYTDSGEVTVEVLAGEDKITFAVRDTGRGIPEQFRDEVYKKFSRLHLSTDSHERGAGLGLAISKGLVEAHGGRIWVESEEGRGTTFRFEIPRRPATP